MCFSSAFSEDDADECSFYHTSVHISGIVASVYSRLRYHVVVCIVVVTVTNINRSCNNSRNILCTSMFTSDLGSLIGNNTPQIASILKLYFKTLEM